MRPGGAGELTAVVSVPDEAASARHTAKLDGHVDVANNKRCEHGGALRHEASLLQRGGYCEATEAGKPRKLGCVVGEALQGPLHGPLATTCKCG